MSGGSARERGMGGLSLGTVPEEMLFEISLLPEFVRVKDGSNLRDSISFRISSLRYFLPLPEKCAIELGVREFLSRGFYIESDTLESYNKKYHIFIDGRGNIQNGTVMALKKFKNFSFGAGARFLFGSEMEEWKTDFEDPEFHLIVDTISSSFFGVGGKAFLDIGIENWRIKTGYSSPVTSNESPSYKFPDFISLSLLHSQGNLLAGVGFTNSFWKKYHKEFRNSYRASLGIEYEKRLMKLRCGVFSHPWYYDKIDEWGGSLGLGISYPDGMGGIDVGFEFARRKGETNGCSRLQETVYRLSITFTGKEKL